jgi:hypothetical protein
VHFGPRFSVTLGSARKISPHAHAQDICWNGRRSKFTNGGEGWAGVGWVIYPLHVGCELVYGWLGMDGPRILHFFGTLGRGSCAAACALSRASSSCVGQARFLRTHELERKDQADIFAFPTSMSSTSWHLIPCELFVLLLN